METHDHFHHAYSPKDAVNQLKDLALPDTRGLVFAQYNWQSWVVGAFAKDRAISMYARSRNQLKLANGAEIVFLSQLDTVGGLLVDYVVAEFDMARDPDTMIKLSIRTLRGKS